MADFAPQRPGDDGCAGNTIGGNLKIQNGAAGAEVGSNQINGGVTLTGNHGNATLFDDASPEVEGNTIRKPLSCTGNVPGVTNDGPPNQVIGARSGQCKLLL